MPSFEDTPLYKAIASKSAEEVKTALGQEGTDICLTGADGNTYLQEAVKAGCGEDVITQLVNVNSMVARNDEGQSVVRLMLAKSISLKPLVDKVASLLKEGNQADLERLLVAGYAKMIAEAKKTTEVHADVTELANVATEAIYPKSHEMQLAIQSGDLDKVKALQSEPAIGQYLLSHHNSAGFHPLHSAILFEQKDIAEHIIKFSSDKQAKDTDGYGRTVHHYAASVPAMDIWFSQLTTNLDIWKDCGVKDCKGKTAADYKTTPLDTTNLKAKITAAPQMGRPLSGKEARSETAAEKAAPNTAAKKRTKAAAAPDTLEAQYIAGCMGKALSQALGEVAEKRPWDPIEYLAQWLYKYKDNQNFHRRQVEMVKEAEAAAQRKVEEAAARVRRREEARRLREQEAREAQRKAEEEQRQKEQEELQRKAKEASQLAQPDLPTVTEDSNEPAPPTLKAPTYFDKNEAGQTKLHEAAAAGSTEEVVALLAEGQNVAERDTEGKTARDLAVAAGHTETVQAIDNSILDIFKAGNVDKASELVEDGLADLAEIVGKYEGDDLPEASKGFLEKLPQVQEKIQALFQTVIQGNVRSVKQELDRQTLALARDSQGRTPLHLAIANGHVELVNFLIETYPFTVNTKDFFYRTPLHYASAVSEELAARLQEAKADPEAVDIKQNGVSYYKENKETIEAMKEYVAPPEGAEAQEGEESGEQAEEAAEPATTEEQPAAPAEGATEETAPAPEATE